MWWDAIIGLAQFGLGAANSISSARAGREQAGIKYDSTIKQIDELNKSKASLNDVYKDRTLSAVDMYGNNLSSLSQKIGIAKSGAGLDYSGTINEVERNSKIGLDEKLGDNLYNLMAQKSEEVGRINSQITGLQAEKDIYDKQKDEYSFLEIGHWFK